MRRLSRFEYNNTVRDAFGDTTRPADALTMLADSGDIVATAQMVEGYHGLAHDYALRVTEDDAATIAFIGCDPASDGEAACQREFLTTFLARAFRRPATTSDLSQFSDVFTNGRTLGGNFRSGVRAVVEVALQSPEFLYRPEFGEPADDRGSGWARPSSYEMASRLSYLYWGSAPDAELVERAENAELADPAVIEAEARRLLADPRARDAIGQFYLDWLGLLDASYPASDTETFPTFTAEIAGWLPEETRTFTAELTLGGGDFLALLTAPYTFVNGPLAGFYGIDGVTGNQFRRVALDQTQRAGILSQAGFLASKSNTSSTSPSRRGATIAAALLCVPLPEEPPDAPTPEPPDPNATTRENLLRTTADPSCQGCHAIFDPLGFAFEHFDAAGLWRDTENGRAIDATGEIVESDVAGERFDGAVELAQLLARSQDSRRCFVQGWFDFAHGRRATTDDACSLETLDRAFQRVDLNLLELLVALSQNDAFLYRPEVTP